MTKRHPLEREFEYYLKNQSKLVNEFNGKFVVIKNEKILGAYQTESEAITETARTNALGTFLVQECAPGRDNYTQTFHSRVAACA